MTELLQLYEEMGLGAAVYRRGEQVLERLEDRFRAIDRRA